MEEVACELCGPAESELYARENAFLAIRCRQCGLVYVSPRPTVHEMKALYDGQETKVDVGAHLRRRDVKSAQARRCLETIRAYQPDGRLLEVGSAAGYLLWEAKKLGYEVQGLDITRAFVEFAQRELGVPTYEGTLADAPFLPDSFDVVYMRNVLSRLAYPRKEYERIRTLLRPGGFLIFETGNVAELEPSVAGKLGLPDHLYLFGEATIRRLLELTGFECRALERYGLVEHAAAVRLASAFVARRKGSAPAKPKRTEMASDAPHMPDSTALGRVEGAIGTAIRYGVGRYAPKSGRRCTLVVVAQRPTT